jgi:hypothetical protein
MTHTIFAAPTHPREQVKCFPDMGLARRLLDILRRAFAGATTEFFLHRTRQPNRKTTSAPVLRFQAIWQALGRPSLASPDFSTWCALPRPAPPVKIA